MRTEISRLARFCMAGILTLVLTLQAGPALAIFAETPAQEEQTVLDNEIESEHPVIDDSQQVDQDPSDPSVENPSDQNDSEEENADSGTDQKDDRLESEENEENQENGNQEENNEEPDPLDPATGFTDTKGHWGTEVIVFWSDREAVTGYPDGTFRPDASITRAEAAALTTKIRKLTGDQNPVFSDVPSDHWAFDQIQACFAFEIIKGTGKGLFKPGESITREAAMTLLYRATDLSPVSGTDSFKELPDWNEVSDWAAEAVGSLLREGIVTGDEKGLLHPGASVTRAEFLTILYRIEMKELWDPSLQDHFALINPKWIVTPWNQSHDRNSGISVTASNLNEQTVVLPSGIDPHSIKLECSLPDPENTTLLIGGNRKLISSTTFDLADLSYPDQDGAYPLTVSISDGVIQRDYHYRVLYGTSLDSLFLSSEGDSGGRLYVDKKKGNAVKGSMQMITPDGRTLYHHTLKELKSRGNSTFEYPKKPYQIKLDEKADLIGNGEEGKTWVLLANYADPTMLKDKLCKDLASDLQLPGTPDCKWVDLYFDGEYRGVYLLTEKIQISSTGLEITDLEEMYDEINDDYGENVVTGTSKNKYGNEIQYTKNLNTPKDSKNGYLIELNHTQFDEINGFLTTRGKGVNIKAPEYLSQKDLKYISEFYQDFEDAVYAVNQRGRYTGLNPTTKRSFSSYCDLDSMIRMYLLYQFSLNADAYFGSTYFYMEDGILHQGPVWDSDLSFGVVWDELYQPDHELQNSYLSEALERLPAFRTAVKKLYDSEFRELALQYTNQILKEYQDQLALSESRNHLIWPEYYKIAAFDVSYDPGTTYDAMILNLQHWMTERIDCLDQKFKDWNR